MELLDRLAGGGAVLAAKFDGNPAPALLVVQGKDEKLMQKFAETALDVLEQELARQDVKARPEKTTYAGVETVHFGKDFHAAVAGATLFVSNNDKALQAAARPVRREVEEEHGGGRRRVGRRQAAAGRPARQRVDQL